MVTLRMLAVVVLVVNLVFLRASLLESQGTYKMQVLSPLNGLRVQTDTAGGQVGSFGGLGEFDVDAPGIIGGRLAVKENGSVGIGVPNPNQRLSVAGMIESTAGGAMSLHSILTTSSGGFDLHCGIVAGAPFVTAQEARFTAVRVGGASHGT